jgi:hypothetical protein
MPQSQGRQHFWLGSEENSLSGLSLWELMDFHHEVTLPEVLAEG